ncbi:MAG: flagellar biosynthetic protein FliR [Parvularculaceae bacterium]|nr:flagellar biosynthetic protein FliR [Parvularculaceae bacterium]
MSAQSLLDALPIDAFVAFAVFCRVGAFFMTAPAFGDFALSPRLRLATALAVAAAMAPAAASHYPDWAGGAALPLMTSLILTEILAGAFLGLVARAFVSALNVAGQVAALQSGFSLAQIFDPSQQLQGAIVAGFFAVLGTTLIFATGLHHVLLLALADSYALMAPGRGINIGDMSEAVTGAVGDAFSLGVRLAAPFILFGLVFQAGVGVLSRLMPQAQVFFMLMPANLAIGLLLLMLTTGLIMSAFIASLDAFLAPFISR